MSARRILLCGLVLAAGITACSSSQGATPEATTSTTAGAGSTTTTATTEPPTTTTTEPPTTTVPPRPKSLIPPVVPASTSPPRPVDVATPVSVLTFGDSTAYPLGWGVRRAADASGLAVATTDFRTSTGLSRPDFFDWPTTLFSLLQTPPEVAVVSFGANDAQNLTFTDGRSGIVFGEPAWFEEYTRRVDGVMQLLTASGVRVYWVGQPLARDPAYTDRMRQLNDVYRSVVETYPGATYVDCWYWMSDDAGNYTDTLPDAAGLPVVVRTDDGIHLNTAGGDFMGAVVVNQLLADYGVQL